ncbi:MAG: MarR family transcriptional regulator [Lactobacillus sp.]|jgi:DNA-binding MarR family transcriptional regulator|nr:MarR family transcriptional regulator [Lactobacillus sp.]MCH3905530.1 MarR family transcriptional regulator [Lactobacillus sp.]MCH3990902.1 MarR family transcriptional regulator [Lactobacillus sp.]MCH4068382.1 MarR family transcriptional regulator [Lactobacillus sp.]MCI1304395.1 MarR family transcriptional regulator [Lactobacillus sp.]
MNEQILRQIGTIARAFDSIANIEFKDLELSRGQYLFLTRIAEQPGIIANQLANLLSVDRTTTARSVQKLVKQGLVEKKADPVNHKIKHLWVTKSGQKLADVIERENVYSNQSVLEGLTKEEQAELARLLTSVEQAAQTSWYFVKNGGKRQY